MFLIFHNVQILISLNALSSQQFIQKNNSLIYYWSHKDVLKSILSIDFFDENFILTLLY